MIVFPIISSAVNRFVKNAEKPRPFAPNKDGKGSCVVWMLEIANVIVCHSISEWSGVVTYVTTSAVYMNWKYWLLTSTV